MEIKNTLGHYRCKLRPLIKDGSHMWVTHCRTHLLLVGGASAQLYICLFSIVRWKYLRNTKKIQGTKLIQADSGEIKKVTGNQENCSKTTRSIPHDVRNNLSSIFNDTCSKDQLSVRVEALTTCFRKSTFLKLLSLLCI